MINKKNLILTNVLVVGFCLLSILVIIYATINNLNGIINVFGNEQEVLVNEIIRQARVVLTEEDADKNKTANEKVVNVIKNQIISGSRYWMFGIDNKVVFLRDESLSSRLDGETFESMFNEYKSNGGENINLIENMLKSKKSGTIIFSKRINAREEILTLGFFQIGDKTYTVGISTAKDSVLSTSKAFETSTYIYIITALSCIIIIVMRVYYSMVIAQKNDEILKSSQELIERNKLIEEYYSNENSEISVEGKDKIYDELTRAYNKKFFMAVSDNLGKKEISPVYIIMINIKKGVNNLDNRLIMDIADIIKESIDKNAMVFRISDFSFAVMLINCDLRKAEVNADIIKDNILELTGGQAVDISVINHDDLSIEQRETELV